MESKKAMPFIILQVSDIECGGLIDGTIVTIHTDRHNLSVLAQTLGRNFYAALPQLGLARVNPNLLVLNGDAVKFGTSAEFDAFENGFVAKALELLAPENVIIVPGNHDVERRRVEEALRAKAAEDTKSLKTQETNTPKISAEQSMVSDIFDGTLDEFWKFVDRVRVRFGDVRWFAPPKSSDESVIPFVVEGNVPIVVFPFSSSDLSGKLETTIRKVLERTQKPKAIANEHYDVAVIKEFGTYEAALETCLTPALRVAVVHHNSFPYPKENLAELKQYNFVNGGQFNNWLFENEFSLLLHGHQHEGRTLRYADLGDRPAESGFRDLLVVGAPAFGSKEAPKPGFTIIVIDRVDSETFKIKVCKVSSVQGASNLTKWPPKVVEVTHYALISGGENKETLRSTLLDMVANGAHLQELNFLAERWKAGPHAQQFFDDLRKARSEREGTKAMYSLSVFAPRLWTENRLNEFFLPEGKRNIAQAVSWAKSIESELSVTVPTASQALRAAKPSLHFHFSKPVCSAIQTADRKAKGFCIIRNVSNELTQKGLTLETPDGRAEAYVARCLSRCSNHPDRESLSIWASVPLLEDVDFDDPSFPNVSTNTEHLVDRLLKGRMNVDDMPISLSTFAFHPNENILEVEQNSVDRQLCEFPRVLLWSPEMLECPTAIQCIEFHENCGFPLFWLDPASLKSPRGKPRYDEGHYSLLARVKGETEYTVLSVRNDRAGRKDPPRIEAEYDPSTNPDKLAAVWGGVQPQGLARNGSWLAEFGWFLGRPDLCFAADAWAVRRFLPDMWEKFAASLAIDVI